MKLSFVLLLAMLLACTGTALAGSPDFFNYQAVARDTMGTPLPGKLITLRFTVHTGSSGGTTVYQETHDSVITDKLGGFSLDIGSGTVTSGTFSAVNWNSGDKYLQVEVDPEGGTSYIDMGTEQIMSVPYALYAERAASVGNFSTYHIPYAGSNGILTSDANFTRQSTSGNTNIKALKGDKYYQLNLGDSNVIDIGMGIMNVPSASLVYGDTNNNYLMTIGVGHIPEYGLTELGFLNLSDSAGNTAAIDFLVNEEGPAIEIGANRGGGFATDGGGYVQISSNAVAMAWHSGIDKIHGVIADSTRLMFYSSDTDYFYIWPGQDGAAGQTLITDGYGNLSFGTASGKGTAMGSLSVYEGNNTATDTIVIVNNKNNVFDPTAGSVTTLRVKLPDSPNDGDVFILTFEKAVTAVVYLNGTVANGAPTTATASTQRIFTYSSGNSKWY